MKSGLQIASWTSKDIYREASKYPIDKKYFKRRFFFFFRIIFLYSFIGILSDFSLNKSFLNINQTTNGPVPLTWANLLSKLYTLEFTFL